MEKEQLIELIDQNPELATQVGQLIEQTQPTEQPEKEAPSMMPGLIALLSMPQMQSIINLYLKNSGKQFQWDIFLRYGLAFTAIGIAGFLGYYDKMDSTMGVLIGSVLGYMFGRKEG